LTSVPVLGRHLGTGLDDAALEHLQRLTASWALLADLSFADLLLYAPMAGRGGDCDNGPGGSRQFIVLAQIRPTTSQTLYREDQVGRVVEESERPLVARACQFGQMFDGEISISKGEWGRIQCIPVRWNGHVLAVLTRESAIMVRRKPGELEQVYVEIFDRFARMIAAGEFPFEGEEVELEEAPRVGDGVMVLDGGQRVEYASPNAVSALHRMGVHSSTHGARLREVGFDDAAVAAAFAGPIPVTVEVERGPVVLLVRVIPLLEHGTVTGGLVLMRDVSDVRRRDRLLLSKDATIREVHHRVKNNLQTISSLLRLQGRRLESPEAKVAVEESVRRIRSIALVHDTLSRGPSEQVPFNEIVRPLVRMVEEGLVSPDREVRFVVEGDAGDLGPEVATPLAVVLTELLQNTVDHAFPDGERPRGQVRISLHNDGKVLAVRVHDDGVGLPQGFSLDDPGRPESLGLTIVRALVDELGGSIDLATDGGTRVDLTIPAA
jgi:two-component sensor histidine kinase